MRRGQRRADASEHSASAVTLTEQASRLVVGRLLDTFGKEAGDVSGRQHPAAVCVPFGRLAVARSCSCRP
jgi:hypothetical protein